MPKSPPFSTARATGKLEADAAAGPHTKLKVVQRFSQGCLHCILCVVWSGELCSDEQLLTVDLAGFKQISERNSNVMLIAVICGSVQMLQTHQLTKYNR